jgi:hypothetical protein
MATGKTADAETPIPMVVLSGSSPFDFAFAEREIDVDGHLFKFREMSVKENDACIDAARQPDGMINGRINMRMMIAKSSVSPKITVDDLAGVPNRIYLKLAEFVNEINSIDDALDEADAKKDEDDEGND